MGTCVFFVLSGFIVGIHGDSDTSATLLSVVRKRVRQVYPYHIFFLLITVPIYVREIVAEPMTSLIKFVVNAMLIQSWIPSMSYALSYNGVSWFLSTLMFLTIFQVPLCFLSVKIESQKACLQIYGLIVVGCCILPWILAYLVQENVRYWLYIFPPIRLLDYIAGFCCGRIYGMHRPVTGTGACNISATLKEGMVLISIFVCLCLSSFIPIAYSRQALYLWIAVLSVYIFAKQEGKIAMFFARDKMVRLGSACLYYMMSHQVIIRYMAGVLNKLSCMHPLLYSAAALLITIYTEPLFDSFLLPRIKKFMKWSM